MISYGGASRRLGGFGFTRRLRHFQISTNFATPDAAGLTFWGDQLASGSTPVGEILLAIAEGAQDVDGGTQDLSTLTNKIDVAADWAASAAAAGHRHDRSDGDRRG